MSRIKQSTFKFLILAFCLFISHSSISQNSKSDRLFEKALNQFHQQKYKSAIHNAKKVIAIDSGFIEAYILSEIFMKSNKIPRKHSIIMILFSLKSAPNL